MGMYQGMHIDMEFTPSTHVYIYVGQDQVINDMIVKGLCPKNL